MDKKKFFDDIAHRWDKEHEISKDKEKLKRIINCFSLKKGDKILDVGCGTGRLVPFLEKIVGSHGFLVESDFSLEMLKIGNNKYKGKNLLFIQADAQMIPLKENSVDVVVCFALFPHLPDKVRALREFHRILGPGKSIIVAHPMSREKLNEFHSQVKGPVAQDSLPAKEEMEKLFSSVGFKNLSIRDEPSLYIAQAKA